MDRPEPLRKTLAIVFCDMVAFSEMLATEGDLVVANILRDFFEHVGRLAKQHRSVTIKFIGDAFLATFNNIDDAIHLIASVQDLLEPGAVLSGRELAFKFSLHLGDILYMQTSYGPDVFGEHVNIAAHLNGLAQPHQLVVSQVALDRLPRDLQAHAGSSESHSFKRIGALAFRRIDLPLSKARE